LSSAASAAKSPAIFAAVKESPYRKNTNTDGTATESRLANAAMATPTRCAVKASRKKFTANSIPCSAARPIHGWREDGEGDINQATSE